MRSDKIARDVFGHVIKVGDRLAYATSLGIRVVQAVYVVTGVVGNNICELRDGTLIGHTDTRAVRLDSILST